MTIIRTIIKRIKSLGLKTYIKINEKSYKEVKYLHIRKNSNDLLVLFSGFNPNNKRSYNYIRSLKGLPCDKLYILDSWGYKGSYYWYEKGNSIPEILCLELIKKIYSKYRHLYTGGGQVKEEPPQSIMAFYWVQIWFFLVQTNIS